MSMNVSPSIPVIQNRTTKNNNVAFDAKVSTARVIEYVTEHSVTGDVGGSIGAVEGALAKRAAQNQQKPPYSFKEHKEALFRIHPQLERVVTAARTFFGDPKSPISRTEQEIKAWTKRQTDSLGGTLEI